MGHRLSTEERGSWGPVSWRPGPGLLELHPGEATCHLPPATCHLLASLGPASGEAAFKAMSTLSCPLSWPLWLPCLLCGPTSTGPGCAPLAQTPLFPLCIQRQELRWVTDHRRPAGALLTSGCSVDSSGSPAVGRLLSILTVSGLDPKGLRSECGGFVQGVSSCNPQPVPNPFLMTVISRSRDE